ncbi:hypothetical protein F5148DRAFT_1150378 [Russula earlei]|uniref:Uncharacterized protein n=1 Tax=Russula earlei TaxID=71964 RepID=A0ACC0U4X0_9AGAM|nr:hypothetical protein F5148DRAFT_1150378 [Russula earlei]
MTFTGHLEATLLPAASLRRLLVHVHDGLRKEHVNLFIGLPFWKKPSTCLSSESQFVDKSPHQTQEMLYVSGRPIKPQTIALCLVWHHAAHSLHQTGLSLRNPHRPLLGTWALNSNTLRTPLPWIANLGLKGWAEEHDGVENEKREPLDTGSHSCLLCRHRTAESRGASVRAPLPEPRGLRFVRRGLLSSGRGDEVFGIRGAGCGGPVGNLLRLFARRRGSCNCSGFGSFRERMSWTLDSESSELFWYEAADGRNFSLARQHGIMDADTGREPSACKLSFSLSLLPTWVQMMLKWKGRGGWKVLYLPGYEVREVEQKQTEIQIINQVCGMWSVAVRFQSLTDVLPTPMAYDSNNKGTDGSHDIFRNDTEVRYAWKGLIGTCSPSEGKLSRHPLDALSPKTPRGCERWLYNCQCWVCGASLAFSGGQDGIGYGLMSYWASAPAIIEQMVIVAHVFRFKVVLRDELGVGSCS